jgi:8-oxo-dGTP pyrophosphatase MutT (NUDIX family)
MNSKLPQKLAARLAEPLPGPMVGSRFEPHPRPWRHDDVAPPDAKPAAVLALLYPHEGKWYLPLTLRPTTLAAHAGQISLPGGAVESGETTAEAAIREFHEELGDDGQAIELLGSLSPLYVQASHYLVTSWVGVVGSRPRFERNPQEVEEILEVPLAHLLDPANFGGETRQYEGQSYSAPCFFFHSHHIWGATCMILGELVTVLEEIGLKELEISTFSNSQRDNSSKSRKNPG